MRWLRLYSEARTDAKLESLPDDEFRVWHRLLCFANEQPVRGLITDFSPRLLAVEVARGDMALLQRTLAGLQELRIIAADAGSYQFIHWQARQYASDNIADRVAKHRKHTSNVTETLQKRYGNVTVTPPDTDTDTDTDTELKRKDSSSSSVSSVAAVADAEKAAPSEPVSTPSESVLAPSVRRSKSVAPRAAAASREPSPAAPRPENPLWDSMVAELDYTPSTKVERSNWGKAVRDLKDVGATPEEIHRRCEHYGTRYGRDKLTVNALVSHWGELATPPKAANGRNGYQARAAPDAGPRLDRITMTTFED